MRRDKPNNVLDNLWSALLCLMSIIIYKQSQMGQLQADCSAQSTECSVHPDLITTTTQHTMDPQPRDSIGWASCSPLSRPCTDYCTTH